MFPPKRLLVFLSFFLLFAVIQATETDHLCITDHDCPSLYNCVETSPELKICVHKPLFPITAREVIATIITVTLNAILTAGGVGAGAAYVPYIILLFKTTLPHSIYIAYLCVFGGGVGNLLNVIRLKNPKTNRYMTNYSLNMIILPALMTGVMIGMILQRIFPPLVTHIILLLTLAYALYKNYGKLKYNLAKEQREREEKKLALRAEEMARINAVTESNAEQAGAELPVREGSKELDEKMEQPPTAEKPGDVTSLTCLPAEKGSLQVLSMAIKPSEVNLNELKEVEKAKEIETASEKAKDPLDEKRKHIYAREQKYPFYKVREIMMNVIVIVGIGLIRGTQAFDPIVGVEWSCGWDFAWFAIAIFAYGLLLTRSLYLVLKWQKEKLEVGYKFLPEEPLMDRPKIVRLVLVATLAGIIGAIVALGGSMITGPTLLDFKMPPAFSAATTSFFMIFAMFNTTFTTLLNKKVSAQELIWFLPLSFLFSFVSSKLVNHYVKRTGKQSVIIKCIMLVAALGFLSLLAIMIKDLVQDTKAQITFKGVC